MKSQPSYARIRRRRFKLDAIEAAPYNARSITQEALRGLGESLARFGVLALPVVNVRHKPPRLVGGHQRVAALRDAGVTEVECVVVDFDENVERQANVALNNPHIEGQFIPALTRELLAEIAQHYVDTSTVSDLRLDTLLKALIRQTSQGDEDKIIKAGKTDDDAGVSVAKSSAVSRVGSVYALGNHLIHCGLVSAPAKLGVFGVDSAHAAFVSGLNLPENASVESLDVLLRHTIDNTSGPIYVPVALSLWPLVQSRFVGCGGHWSNTVVVHGTGSSVTAKAFNQTCVVVCYGWRVGQAHAFHGGRDQGNVWRMKTAVGCDLPVEAVVRAVLHSTVADAVVLDPIADGGATAIACEKTGRRLVGYASTPREVDRVRRRWAEFVHGEGADWKALTTKV